MTKSKPCRVCTILNNDTNLSNYINNRLKQDVKIAEIRDDFISYNIIPPTKYFLEEHKKNCLKDFKVELKQLSTSFIDKSCSKDKNNDNNLNLLAELQRYRSMDDKEKLIDKVNRFNEIEFMCAVTVHHQLSYNDITLKTAIPKENISALKQIEDILKNIEDLEKNKPLELPNIVLNFMDKYGQIYKTDNGDTSYRPDTRKDDPRDSEDYLKQFDTKHLEDYLRSVDAEDLKNYIEEKTNPKVSEDYQK